MNTPNLSYPIFNVGKFTDSVQHILAQVISEVTPSYFEHNPRFEGLGKISSMKLVDFVFIQEEDEWWLLTVIQTINDAEQVKYVFLPLICQYADAETPFINSKLRGLGTTIFGLETSDEMGLRDWKMTDAFDDIRFNLKLIDLFLPWDDVPANHENAYLSHNESGIGGKFRFYLHPNIQLDWEYSKGVLFQITKAGDTLLEYADTYQLLLYQVLPTLDDVSTLQSSPDVLGWISYSGIHNPEELVIGVLGKRIFHI